MHDAADGLIDDAAGSNEVVTASPVKTPRGTAAAKLREVIDSVTVVDELRAQKSAWT